MLTLFLIWAALFCGVGLVLMLLLSHPLELRPRRWLKISLSLPVLIYAAYQLAYRPQSEGAAIGNVLQYVSCAGVGLALWGMNIAWLGAQLVNQFLFGSGRGGGGFRPDFREAKMFIKENDLEAAIKSLERELAKEPANYEGRMLLASIYHELKQPQKGLEQINFILANADATPGQIEAAHAAQHQLRVLQLQLDAERQGR
ncbi:MAG: hypothetical protein AAB466_13090 [Verrucomicrobiota bacterium]